MSYGKAFFAYTTTIKLVDALVFYLAWHAAWFLRFQTNLLPIKKGIPAPDLYHRAAIPLVLVFCIVFHVVGAYRSSRVPFGFRALKKLLEGTVFGVLVSVSVLYFAQAVSISRVYIGAFSALLFVFLMLDRVILHFLWRSILKRVTPLRVLLVGHGDLLDRYVRRLEREKRYPIHWIGQVGIPPSPPGVFHLGELESLELVLAREKINTVVLSFPEEEEGRYGTFLQRFSKELVDIKVLPDFGKENTFTYQAEEECGIPLLAFNRAPVSVTDRFFKRTLDVVGSLLFLVVFSPLYALIALCIKLGSRGPVFYRQSRVGADGKVFMCYKFRSMRVDAEKETGPVWATKDDPRVTPLGKFLRRSSLDEIPQFLNVLKGDMSLVGPRPERPVFVDRFRSDIPGYMLRHKMKSGVTGWAQVHGLRGNTSLEERITHDLYYIGHWSHRLDIKILILTFFRVFSDRNAY